MVRFLFSVHTITEAKQSNGQTGSQGGGSSSQVIWPGAPWCSAAIDAAAVAVMVTVGDDGYSYA